MSNQTTQLSIVLPFYNEKKSITVLIAAYEKYSKKYNFELICVNNGSTDGSAKIFQKYKNKKKYNFVTIITVKKNIGYGHGIMSGVKKARGTLIAWTHADMQTPPADVFKAYEIYQKQHNPKSIVKGKRFGRPIFAAFVSKCMGIIATILLGTSLSEINAQPKLFHRSFLPQLTKAPNDFLLDLFFLYQAKKHKYHVYSFPVQFHQRQHGKSKWAYSFPSKLKMIINTIQYILFLAKKNL